MPPRVEAVLLALLLVLDGCLIWTAYHLRGPDPLAPCWTGAAKCWINSDRPR